MASLREPVLLSTQRHLTEEGVARVSSGQLPVGTVLLSSRAPIGYLAIAEVAVTINQGIIAMVCDLKLPNLYALQWARINIEVIKANASGTTFEEISKRSFRPIPVILPPRQTLAVFTAKVRPLYDRLVESVREVKTLAVLRDTLLPKLISGELRVKDAERFVGEAVGS